MKTLKVTLKLPNKEKANNCYNYLLNKKAKIIGINKKRLEIILEIEVE